MHKQYTNYTIHSYDTYTENTYYEIHTILVYAYAILVGGNVYT